MLFFFQSQFNLIIICWIWNTCNRSHKLTPCKNLGGAKHFEERATVSWLRDLEIYHVPTNISWCHHHLPTQAIQMSHIFVVSLQCTSKLTLHYWASSVSPPSPVTSAHFSLLIASWWLIHPKRDNMRTADICWTGKNHKILVGFNVLTWPKLKIILNLVTNFIHVM